MVVWDDLSVSAPPQSVVEVKGGFATGQDVITVLFKAIRTIKDGDKVVVEKEKKLGPDGTPEKS